MLTSLIALHFTLANDTATITDPGGGQNASRIAIMLDPLPDVVTVSLLALYSIVRRILHCIGAWYWL
jgi:hypothetical protein